MLERAPFSNRNWFLRIEDAKHKKNRKKTPNTEEQEARIRTGKKKDLTQNYFNRMCQTRSLHYNTFNHSQTIW